MVPDVAPFDADIRACGTNIRATCAGVRPGGPSNRPDIVEVRPRGAGTHPFAATIPPGIARIKVFRLGTHILFANVSAKDTLKKLEKGRRANNFIKMQIGNVRSDRSLPF